MRVYSFTVTQTSFDRTVNRWVYIGGVDIKQARSFAINMATRDGWTPPKWWQWWRIHDTKLPQGMVRLSYVVR